MLLQSSTLSNQDISTVLLAGTYTATQEISDMSIQVILGQIAGDGSYSAYATRQIGGAGAEYKSSEKSRTVAESVTDLWFATIRMGVNAGDVVRIYVTGLPADTTTPDVICEFWGLSEPTTGAGSSDPIYASLAEFKAWIAVRGLAGAVGTDASDDTVISALLEAASRYLDRETGKRFYYNAVD